MRMLKLLPILLLAACTPNSYEEAAEDFPEAVEAGNMCAAKASKEECLTYCYIKYPRDFYWERLTCQQTVRKYYDNKLLEQIENDAHG